MRYDLLDSALYRRLTANPGILAQECRALKLNRQTQTTPVIVDEVQKVPELLDEVHRLIEDDGIRFLLCGSSARKLKRSHANLLGGRAVRYELRPLCFPEIPDYCLGLALNRGLIPRHYLTPHATNLFAAYVGDYLENEIAAEALSRNIPAFSRFLEVAAISNGELLNSANIASECGVSAPTVRQYFQILIDTLLGRWLPAYTRRQKRRLITAPKFYFFDLAPVIHLTHRGAVEPGSELFGRAFEHLVWMEITAQSLYSGANYPLAYWRTASGFEVDFILGQHAVAIEVKSSDRVVDHHLTGLRAFKQEYKPRQSILVSLDAKPRLTDDGILILPWKDFFTRLWAGEFAP
jgi:predicted AAA+ superfamily ATPase